MKLDKIMSQSKCGLIDFSCLCPGANCYLLSIAFAIFVTKLNCNFDLAIDIFLRKHRFNYDIFINCQLYPLSVGKIEQMDIWSSLDLISSEKRVNIEVFSETSEKPKIYMIFATKNMPHNNFPSIYIKFKEDTKSMITHIDYIFDLGLLNVGKKGKTCNICKKHFSYSWYPVHKCKFEKCFMCMRHMKNKNFHLSENLICHQNSDHSTIKCAKCRKVFKNEDCFQHHKKHVCQKYKSCNVCKTFYTIGYAHKCHEKFCRICFQSHGKTDIYCRYSSKSSLKKKEKNGTFFADIHWSVKDNIPLLICANIMNSTLTDIDGMIFCQNVTCNIKHFDVCMVDLSGVDKSVDLILKSAIENFLLETNEHDTLVIICKLNVFNQFKSYLSSKQKPLSKISNNSFAFGKLIFKIFQNFVDINDIKIAYALGKNPNLANISPKMSLTDNSIYHYISEDFATENLVFGGDNIDLFEAISWGKKEVEEIFDKKTINYIYFYQVVFKTLNAVIALQKACSIFKLMVQEHAEKNVNLFDFNTLTESGFSLLAASLSSNDICILPNKSPSKYKNSSKTELIMCSLFDRFHSKVCRHGETFSFVSNSGNQFKVGNLSLDWFCKKCKIGVMIEGCQKTQCFFHPQKPKHFFGKSSESLFHISQNNRIRLLKESKGSINKILTINECCCYQYSPIWSKIFQTLGPKKFSIKLIWKQFQNLFDNFELSKYHLPDFQDSILPSLVVPSCCYVSHNEKYQTCRFDMHTAYLNALFQQPIPKGEPISLIGKSAFDCFQNQILPKKMFAILSVTILPPKHGMASTLPFFVYKNSNGVHLTLCKTCTIKDNFHGKCIHSETERQFDVTCLLSDLLHAMDMGYTIININSVYYWPHAEKVSYLDNVLVKFMKYIAQYKSDRLKKIFLKRMALQGLGRFAFNLENTLQQIECFEPSHFQLELEKTSNIYYQVNDQKAIFESKFKGLNYHKNYRHAVSAKINPIIFALANNMTRIDIHKKAIECMISNSYLAFS